MVHPEAFKKAVVREGGGIPDMLRVPVEFLPYPAARKPDGTLI